MLGWLNLGSLILGLIAWFLPVINLIRYEKHDYKSCIALSIMSLSACAISLCFQNVNNYFVVTTEDWTALMDTAGALALIASVLLIVTIILNAITFIVYRGRTAE